MTSSKLIQVSLPIDKKCIDKLIKRGFVVILKGGKDDTNNPSIAKNNQLLAIKRRIFNKQNKR